jgi:hypothetical protein
MKTEISAIENVLPSSIEGVSIAEDDATLRDKSTQPWRGLNLSTRIVQQLFCECSSIIQRKSVRNRLIVLFMSLIGVCMAFQSIATRVIPT